ncbi:unnamed protein product [Caenorhabditis auriculariae]|uniref:Ubiquitin carboxyl-terminal hydrolase n=1 Tax=Caenorhabditis auriculariae TaxID=2777116 RepID=A0A8S1H283_9PELO|nr:unnamed protein product [Caenorhabditis auriculariae]
MGTAQMPLSQPELLDNIRASPFTQISADSKIYKDECTYCFKSPFFEGGILVCLKTYFSFCEEHAQKYAQKTSSNLFLRYKSKRTVEKEKTPSDPNTGEPITKMTKLSIDPPKVNYTDEYFLTVYPHLDQNYPISDEVGSELVSVTEKVISSVSAERLNMISTSSNAWDADVKLITKHKDLVQLDNGKKIPVSGWKCEEEGCDINENLWLNLTDGAIRCGRSQFVSETVKSRGNGHMQQYYSSSGNPLVVKLGTISHNLDAADVYSYDEDDSVIDPNLERHLAHFGIDHRKMERTEKSIMEMEMDLNEKWEWAKCQEDGAELESIFGPGYTGIINLGSSCYMNSVLQALIQVEDFKKRYDQGSESIFEAIPLEQVHTDLNAQLAKVITSMLSGEFAREGSDLNAIKPRQFKLVMAEKHREFATARQQDVEEYIRFLFERIKTNTPEDVLDPSYAFRFKLENRFQDVSSGKVRYSENDEVLLHLPIAQELMEPIEGVENRFRVQMSRAVEYYLGTQTIEGYKSPVTGEIGGATTTLRFKTYPDYLLVQSQKFAYTNMGEMKKLDIDMEVAETLDISSYRGSGIQANEDPLPEDIETPKTSAPVVPSAPPAAQPAYDQSVVEQLVMMGFTENASVKAAIAVGTGGVEAAVDWVMGRLDDATLNDPPVQEAPTTAQTSSEVDPNQLAMVMALGFTAYQAKVALQRNPQVEVACDWLFSNVDSIPAEEPAAEPAPAPAPAPPPTPAAPQKERELRDGNGVYELIGFISHMGSRPDSGHYVAHMLKDGKWILFNDEKVAISQNPPKQLAYVYLYKRKTN